MYAIETGRSAITIDSISLSKREKRGKFNRDRDRSAVQLPAFQTIQLVDRNKKPKERKRIKEIVVDVSSVLLVSTSIGARVPTSAACQHSNRLPRRLTKVAVSVPLQRLPPKLDSTHGTEG